MKRGTAYNRCLAGQSSTANVPCEAGVVAEDAIDGVSIQNRVSLGFSKTFKIGYHFLIVMPDKNLLFLCPKPLLSVLLHSFRSSCAPPMAA